MSVAAKLLCGELAGWEARLISPKQEERWPESKFKLFFSYSSFSVLPKQRCRPLASGQDSEQTREEGLDGEHGQRRRTGSSKGF